MLEEIKNIKVRNFFFINEKNKLSRLPKSDVKNFFNLLLNDNLFECLKNSEKVRDENFVKLKTIEELFELGTEISKSLNKKGRKEIFDELIMKETAGVMINLFILIYSYDVSNVKTFLKEYDNKLKQIIKKSEKIIKEKESNGRKKNSKEI